MGLAMRLRIVCVLVCACLGACASLDRGREDAELRALGAAAYDSAATRALEANVLAHAGARAKREGDALSLTTEHGGPVVLTNKPGCEDETEDNCIFFTLAADLASRHAYVVAISFYEGSDFLLIDDRSGRRTQISGAPRFAPGEDALFVTIDNDGEFDGPNIEIDGWGLVLWAARTYVEMSGDAAWLSSASRTGTVYHALTSGIAAPLAFGCPAPAIPARLPALWPRCASVGRAEDAIPLGSAFNDP